MVWLSITGTNAQSLFEENFNYTNGQLTSITSGANVSGGNWVNASGTGALIQVSSGNLSYTNWMSGPIGGKISIASPTSSGEDIRRGFTDQLQTANSNLYAGMLLNVTNINNLSATTGDYFLHFTNVAGTGGGFHSRVYIKSNGTGFNLGLQTNTGLTVTWDNTVFNVNTTYLLIIGYEIVTGTNNDIGRLWVNPTLSGTSHPTPLISTVVTTGTEPDGIDAFGIRQATNTPNAEIDAIRVGLSWSAGTLPVQFKSFTATKGNDAVNLKWASASESNNKGFEIQRSVNGAKYQTVAFIKSAGNSNVSKSYSYNDMPSTSGSVCYRLKQFDFDGANTYSKVACVNIEAIKTTEVITTPNPFNTSLHIKYNSLNDGSANMQIIDMLGKTHQNTNMSVNKGENMLTLDTDALPLGIYFIRITNGTEVTTQRIVKR